MPNTLRRCCLLLMLVFTANTDAGQSEHQVVGLHIGIGAYTSDLVSKLTLHHTTEKFLLPLMGDQYGVQWMPSALDVNRDGFHDALLGLLHEASAIKANGSDVTVLLMYTGHGSRVRDQDGDEPDHLDETFVTIKGTLTDGSQDVRDDDIYAFRRALAAEGIHFTFIAESCHSESSSRGPATLNLPRGDFSAGPTERLFPEPTFDKYYTNDEKLSPADIVQNPQEQASFVSITAAGDRQLARTLTVDGTQWGVLSLAMYRTISQSAETMSYSEFYAALTDQAREIDRALQGTPQTPFLHSEGEDASRQFLGRTPVPFAIRIRELHTGTGILSAGFETGMSVSTVVGLYHSYEEMSSDSEPAATAVVTSAGIGQAVIEGASLEVGMYCKVQSAGLGECLVYIDPSVPEPISSRLLAREAVKSLVISDSFDSALFIVESSFDGSSIEIRWVREPVVKSGTPRVAPISQLPAKSDSGLWNTHEVVDELERLVRIQRFLGMNHQPELIDIRWGESRADLEDFDYFESSSTRADYVVESGDSYFIKITNLSDLDLWFHQIEIFETDTGLLGAQLNSQCPSGIKQPYMRLTPGGSHIVSSEVSLSTGAGREEVTHLWIASESPMDDLYILLSRGPETKVKRGVQNPVMDMLEDVTGANSAMRGGVGEWAARAFNFSILPKNSQEGVSNVNEP